MVRVLFCGFVSLLLAMCGFLALTPARRSFGEWGWPLFTLPEGMFALACFLLAYLILYFGNIPAERAAIRAYRRAEVRSAVRRTDE